MGELGLRRRPFHPHVGQLAPQTSAVAGELLTRVPDFSPPAGEDRVGQFLPRGKHRRHRQPVRQAARLDLQQQHGQRQRRCEYVRHGRAILLGARDGEVLKAGRLVAKTHLQRVGQARCCLPVARGDAFLVAVLEIAHDPFAADHDVTQEIRVAGEKERVERVFRAATGQHR